MFINNNIVKGRSRFRPSLICLALAASGLGSLSAIADQSVSANQMLAESNQQQESSNQQQENSNQQAETTQAETKQQKNEQAESSSDTSDAPDNDDEKLIITGFRGSLLRSIDEKRNADTVTEQLSADDLGGLPDVSIADALTRLPGIAAVRTGGQAAEINIRGLSGVFVHTTLNGREQVSTSGSRSVEFDQYPSELISGATIYKSQKASLIEGGVAGSVELRTASPLQNREDHKFNVNLRGMFNDRADEVFDAQDVGYRFSLSYQGKYLDDTLGLSLGFARLYQPNVAVQFIGFAYNATADVDGVAGDTGGPDNCPECEYVSEGFEMQHRGGEETRDGYMAAVEWTPTNDFTLKADAFISKFDSEAFARGFRVKFDGSLASIYNPVVRDNLLVGGTINRNSFSNTRVEMVNDDNTDFDKVESYGVNANWNLTGQFDLSVDLSRSSATSDFRNGLLWSLVAEDANAASPVFDENIQIAYQLNGLNLPNVGLSQNFTDLSRVMVSKYGIYPFQNSDAVNALAIDTDYQFVDNDWLRSLEVGARYSERRYSNDRSVFEFGADNRFMSSQPPLMLDSSFAHSVNFSGDFSSFPSYLAIDLNAALSAWFPNGVPQPVQTWGANAAGEIDNHSSWSVLQSGDVFEDVLASYFVLNLDGEVGDTPVKGNVGIRRVDTDQFATAFVNVDGDVQRGAQNIVDEAGLVNSDYARELLGVKYTRYLPQLNLNFGITDNSQIRFAGARVMSRPPINRLASTTSGQVDGNGRYNASSTNSPFLLPFLADQYDLSYEYFFDDTPGALVAALFYKDIKNFVETFTIAEYDFEGNGIALPQYAPGTEPGNPDGFPPVEVTNGSFTTAVNNDKGGYFRGVELAYTQVYSFLPDFWSGLGVSASYAYTESEVTTTLNLAGQDRKISFPGLSKHVANVALFWDYEDFETRVNVRYRSDFVSDQMAIGVQTTNFDSETVVDYQAAYSPTDDFKILFQVNNLTDEPTKSYFGDPAYTGTVQAFGRQFFLGASYSL